MWVKLVGPDKLLYCFPVVLIYLLDKIAVGLGCWSLPWITVYKNGVFLRCPAFIANQEITKKSSKNTNNAIKWIQILFFWKSSYIVLVRFLIMILYDQWVRPHFKLPKSEIIDGYRSGHEITPYQSKFQNKHTTFCHITFTE